MTLHSPSISQPHLHPHLDPTLGSVGISSKLCYTISLYLCRHTKQQKSTIGMWNVVFIDKISFQNDLTCMKNSQTKSKTGFVVKSLELQTLFVRFPFFLFRSWSL